MRTSTGEDRLRRGAIAAAVAASILLAGAGAPAHAITTTVCLATKLKGWGDLRNCQRNEEAKAVRGQPANRARCQERFASILDSLRTQAANSAIPCRYRDNGDNTVTDFDTGLMWAKQGAFDGATDVFNVLDLDDTFSLPFAAGSAASLTGTSTTGTSITPVPGIGAYPDWRLPTIVELTAIVDKDTLACQVGGACIDPIFGPTAAMFYWSATTVEGSTGWFVSFATGELGVGSPGVMLHARPVRSAF